MKLEIGMAQNPDKSTETVAPAFVINIGISGESKICIAAALVSFESFSSRPCKLSDIAVSINAK